MEDRSGIHFSSLDQLNVALSAQKAGGVDLSEFKQVVTLIHAPDSLKGLMCLLSNLSKVMPLAIDIARSENDEETIDQILSPIGVTTEKLLKLSDVFRSEGYTQLFSTKLLSAYDIFKRQLSKSPVYACLGLRPQGNEDDSGFDLLQAHLIIFSTRYFGNDLGSHENLFRAMADLCDLKCWKDLASLPDVILPSDHYYDRLRNCESERLQVIGTLFDELPKRIRKKKPEKKTAKKRRRKSLPAQMFPGGFGKISALPASRKTLLTDDDADEYEKGGGRPDEIPPPEEEIPLDVPEDVLSGATFRNLCFMAKAESNRRAMNNQLFRYSWHEASLHDLSVLIDYLRGSLNLPDDTPSTIEIRVLLYLSLFTSRDVQSLLDWIVLSSEPADEGSLEGICTDARGQLYVRIFSPGPEITDENRDREWPQAYPVITYSCIPLPNICSEIQEYLNPTDKLPGAELFSGDVKSRYQEAYQVIRRLRNVRSSRMSRGRISQYMINELSRMEGEDLPKAALYFGLDVELATTRVHYSIAHLPAMENSYRILCNNITADLGLQAAFDSCTPGINPDAYVGSPFCPRLDAVQELIAKMLRKLAEFSNPDLEDKGALTDYHNGYTLYCALQTAYASGNRAISDRSFKTKEVDSVTGMAVISDKDTPDYYSSRQVWIHPMCREQIKHYQQHLLALFDRVGLDSSPLFSLFKNLSWPNVLTSFFIFTDKDLNCFEQLTPSLLRTALAMEYGYDMPPNSNRHFLKNQLLNYQCPQEVVEAFLGHWHNGQEPWCSLSGLHPADYRNELQTHLSAILDACGWCYLPSKLL